MKKDTRVKKISLLNIFSLILGIFLIQPITDADASNLNSTSLTLSVLNSEDNFSKNMEENRSNYSEIKITASDAELTSSFGSSVAIYGDTIVVGASSDDTAGENTGAVYIFQWDQGGTDQWVQVKKLNASDALPGDLFGDSVSIYGDTIVVGARSINNVNRPGAAYVFQRDYGGTDQWGEVKKLTASDVQSSDDEFGDSVSLSGDTIVVGDLYDDAGGYRSGAAYVFQRNQGGTDEWGEVKKLTATDNQEYLYFGKSVSIDQDTLVVGALFRGAYVFQRDQGGFDQWGEVKKLTASDGDSGNYFGWSISISGDTLVVGADSQKYEGIVTGAAYIFQRNHAGIDEWGEVKKLIASDAQYYDEFGESVAISGDTVVIGAYDEDLDGDIVDSAGAAYVFQRNQEGTNQWGEVEKLTSSTPEIDAYFGNEVAIHNDTIVIGATGEDPSGAVYVFEKIPQADIQIDLDHTFGFEDWDYDELPPSNTIVSVYVKNVGNVDVSGTINLYANDVLIGQGVYAPGGALLPPTYTAAYEFTWDLVVASGYVENIELKAIADIDGYTDINPQDNEYSENISLYWADFPLDRDAYNFANSSYSLQDLFTDSKSLFTNLLHVGQAINNIVMSPIEWGGRCYGIASTSVLYRDYPELRPASYSTTYIIPEEEALPMIRKYQRNQILYGILDYDPTNNGIPVFNEIVTSLKGSDPVLLSIKAIDAEGNHQNHAVVTYKAIQTESERILLIYDSNFDDNFLIKPSELVIDPSGSFLYEATYDLMHIGEARLLPDDFIMVEALKKARELQIVENLITVVVGSPVDTIVLDSFGHRLGMVGDQLVDEIPGSYYWYSENEEVILLVPANNTYMIESTAWSTFASGSSTMSLGYAVPIENSLLEVSFQDITLEPDGVYSTNISFDPNIIDDLNIPGGGSIPPNTVELIDDVIPSNNIFLPLLFQ